jgi:curved DNA-binding protein CbpA
MTDTLDKMDYYRLLGIEPSANADAIRNAYHAFALKFHPDRHVGSPGPKVERAGEIFRRGAEAYRVLTDPEERRRYDAGLRDGKLRLEVEEQAPASRRPSKSPNSVGLRARPFVQKAEAALKAGDPKQAMLHLKIALSHDPDNEHIKELIAQAQRR